MFSFNSTCDSENIVDAWTDKVGVILPELANNGVHGMKLNSVFMASTWTCPVEVLIGNSNCQASTLSSELHLQSLHTKVTIVFILKPSTSLDSQTESCIFYFIQIFIEHLLALNPYTRLTAQHRVPLWMSRRKLETCPINLCPLSRLDKRMLCKSALQCLYFFFFLLCTESHCQLFPYWKHFVVIAVMLFLSPQVD